jgi:hypothetical protein
MHRVKKFQKNIFLSMAIDVFALFEFFSGARRPVFLLIFSPFLRFFELEVTANEPVPSKRLP